MGSAYGSSSVSSAQQLQHRSQSSPASTSKKPPQHSSSSGKTRAEDSLLELDRHISSGFSSQLDSMLREKSNKNSAAASKKKGEIEFGPKQLDISKQSLYVCTYILKG